MKRFLNCYIVLMVLVSCCIFYDATASNRFKKADSLVNDAIEKHLIPGGVLAVLYKGEQVYLKAYGNSRVYPSVKPIKEDDVFDLASVTKPFTAMAVMKLIEEGKLRLNNYAADFLPYLPKDIRIIHLLTHTSGIPDYNNVKGLVAKYGRDSREAIEDYIQKLAGKNPPKKQFEYSCLNYVTLQYIVEKISGMSLKDFCKKYFFIPLQMNHTDFNPTGDLKDKCAPTEKQIDGSVLQGVVHDSLALYLNKGISGNAGLFTNVQDLVIFTKMFMNQGTYNGIKILSELTVNTMCTVPKGYEEFGRSLGWDNYSSYSSDHGDLLDKEYTYGHTGYTGPGMLIDPINQIGIVFLTHRVHPYNVGSLVDFRCKLANIIAGIIK